MGVAILRSTVRRSSVRSIFRLFVFFPILVSFFCRFLISRNFFRENFFEKKRQKILTRKNLRKKFKMENQRKKLESRNFFEKKGNREPSKRKISKKNCTNKLKNYQSFFIFECNFFYLEFVSGCKNILNNFFSEAKFPS